MWSYIQYRQIGKDVRRELKARQDRSPIPQVGATHTRLRSLKCEETANASRVDSASSSTDKVAKHRVPPGCNIIRQDENHKEDIENTSDVDDPHKVATPDNSLSEDSEQALAPVIKVVVDVCDDNDPINPQNWSKIQKQRTILLLFLLIFVQAWAGASESMANKKAAQSFGISVEVAELSTAMYLFGIGSGAIFAGPIADTVGRNPTYLVSTAFYLVFVLGSALTPTFGGSAVCRFLVGLFASATLSINGASVRDLANPKERNYVYPLVAWANVVGPVIAPIVGGAILSNLSLSWRWTEWITLIISGFVFILCLLFLPETSLPVLLEWRAAHLRQQTGDDRYESRCADSQGLLQKVKTVLPMPITLFTTDLVIAVLGAYMTLLYILLFSFLTGFSFIFQDTYKIDSLQEGACFASIAIGATLFLVTSLLTYAAFDRRQDRARQQQHTKSDEEKESDPELQGEEEEDSETPSPEQRLWPAILTSPLLPIALFLLGWTSRPSIPIWVPLTACLIFGIVIIAMYVSIYEYIIDAYSDRAAVALASITAVRYLIAGTMVIAARPMYEGIGVAWVLTFLACLACVLAPAPLLFWWFGKEIRRRSKFAEGGGDD